MRSRVDLVHRHHQRLLDIINVASPLITESMGDTDVLGLRYLRQEMVEALASYARLLADLADEAEARGDGRALLEAAQLRERCLGMGTRYQAFCERWEHRKAHENWHEYRLSAVGMMRRIRGQVLEAVEYRAAAGGPTR